MPFDKANAEQYNEEEFLKEIEGRQAGKEKLHQREEAKAHAWYDASLCSAYHTSFLKICTDHFLSSTP